ncbi:MAG TPA: ATP-dependent helicase, partial [Bacteroidales bacterium]|nr:ATP-dependent helicase [Bacteroidales bacterium]
AKPRATLLPKGSDIPVTFVSHGQKVHFRQSTRSKAFSQGWGEEGYHNQFIDRGKRYHYLFSAIHTANDVEAAVNDLVHEGLLSLNEVEETLTYAQKALQQPQAADWFSGRYKLFNECSILTHDNQGHTVLKRPDRVMLAPDHLTVVDFKFGQPAASHQRQVAEYMQLLTQMGYPNVQGYLWYVDNETVVTVSPSAAF